MEVAEKGTLLQEIVKETRTLISAIDDIRSEIEWIARNLSRARPQEPVQPITSMALDPCDPAWAAKLSTSSSEDVSTESPADSIPPTEESAVESLVYCCKAPRLSWQGDPYSPSVVCEACGYVVAEYGNVVDDRAEHKDGFRRETQGQLWADDES
jgi:hypothetical protein